MPAVRASTGLSITNPLVLYRALVATKKIAPDPAQHRLALHLQKLYFRLKDYDPEIEYRDRLDQISRSINRQSAKHGAPGQRVGPTRGRISRLWPSSESGERLALTRSVPVLESAMKIPSPQGLMLYGEVGRGKSMLLDLLFTTLPSRKKKRWHFNTFMLDIFRRLERSRIERLGQGIEFEHSVLSLAKETVSTSPILFLDEFQLPDRTSSKLLNGFMTSFFHLGGVMIASSNRMPEELAKASGVEFGKDTMGDLFGWTKKRSEGEKAAQSDFGQFLEVLKARCEVWEMEGERDWRREIEFTASDEDENVTPMLGGSGREAELDVEVTPSTGMTAIVETTQKSSDAPSHYHIAFPADSADASSSTAAWLSDLQSLNPSLSWTSSTIHVYGRKIAVPSISVDPPGTTIWSFPDLCASNLGPADYISLASNYHTIVLEDIPVLTLLQKNEARRFITLLDALYESKCRLLIRAAAPPDQLFFPEMRRGSGTLGSGNQSDDSVYQEMYSEVYQDSTAPFRPNVSSYLEGDTSAMPTPSLLRPELRSILADEDADFGPTYGNGRGHGQAAGPEGMEELIRRQGPDFTQTSGLTGVDERFAYKRARSRLWEMCGDRWWKARSHRHPDDWWMPVGREVRQWEKSPELAREIMRKAGLQTGGSHDGSARSFDPNLGDPERDHGIFRHGASPYRTASDPPPRLTERHVWGMGLWGPKAGRWGRGETREERDGQEKG